MSRIVKKPEIRYAEILDASEKLFTEKGYEQTAVSEIVKSINVAQGTFYYYFKSKEDVLDSVVLRLMTRDVSGILKYLASSRKSPLEKLVYICKATYSSFQGIMGRFFHDAGSMRNSGVKSLERQRRRAYTLAFPLHENIIKEGVRQGVFTTDDPKETALFILGTLDTLIYDEGGIASEAVIKNRKKTAQFLIECLLGIPHGKLKL